MHALKNVITLFCLIKMEVTGLKWMTYVGPSSCVAPPSDPVLMSYAELLSQVYCIVCACVRVCVHVCMCVYVVCVCMHMCVMQAHIHTHTEIHTYCIYIYYITTRMH